MNFFGPVLYLFHDRVTSHATRALADRDSDPEVCQVVFPEVDEDVHVELPRLKGELLVTGPKAPVTNS